jgi:predicted transcriptional regulator
VTFRRAADLVECDVKIVRSDLAVLVKAGIVDRAEDGVVFPYEALKIDYELIAPVTSSPSRVLTKNPTDKGDAER